MTRNLGGIPILKRKEVNFRIEKDLSGGVRLRWNQDSVLLSPEEARDVIVGIADALDIELASFPETN